MVWGPVVWIPGICKNERDGLLKGARFEGPKPLNAPNHQLIITLPETNIAPNNGWLEHYFPIGEAYFQGLC